MLGLYWLYSSARNEFGSASVSPRVAFDNALEIIDIERWMGLFFEETVQGWFLDYEWFLWLSNVFYGTFHFAVTIGVLVWLFRRFPERYRVWRASIAWTTVLALVGFSLYPLMPPRLLGVCPTENVFGGCSPNYDFVDTLAEYGGLWTFDQGRMAELSNQYAAMPSLHMAWAIWCFLALAPVLSTNRARVLAALYPCVTLFVIIITGNHFWLDAVGGAVVLAAGIFAGHLSIRVVDQFRAGLTTARGVAGDDPGEGPAEGAAADEAVR